MSYPFIDLKKSTKEDLVAHLREHCGIEKDGKKEDLVQSILEFESINGLARPGATESVNQSQANSSLHDHKRVRVIIAPSETDNSDVYVGIGDWDALIKRGEEVSIPYPAYLLLAGAGEYRFKADKEGNLDKYFAPRFSITMLGDA